MTEVLTGFHGKLPAAGDFVTRGLPVGFQAFWDRWAAQHLAPRQVEGAAWPEGGLRLRLQSGGKVAAGVVLPGADRVGRRFPLAAFVIAPDLPGPDGLDAWCNGAHAALAAAQETGQGPEDLLDTLDDLAPPEGEGADLPAFLIWAATVDPVPCDPSAPGAALDPLFSCS